MVDRATWQIYHLNAGCRDACVANGVGKAQNRIRIGDIKIITNQRHAEWRVQALQKRRP